MSQDTNSVVEIGRLTRDAELTYTGGGFPISKFSIAVNKNKKSADGNYADYASFFDVVLFGKTAEALKQYLLKGKQVAINGELEQQRWEKDGQQHSKVVINAYNIQLLGGDKPQGNQQQPANTYNQQQPQQQQGYQQQPAQQSYQQPQQQHGYQQQPQNYQQPQQQFSDYGQTNCGFTEDIPF